MAVRCGYGDGGGDGAENAIFEEKAEIRTGLTYMTGALVRLGHRLALALRGGSNGDWPVYAQFGVKSLWLAVMTAALLAIAQALRPGARQQS